ncbi:MAG: InlB B-repeat-containing protein [Clostridiales bacterium]|nr:InlB B-repeat-containing protein [Clostridiales bacterium]
MKKIVLRIIAAMLCAVIMVGIVPIQEFGIKANAYGSSVVNRDDGKWLFPADGYSFNDWCGCNDKKSTNKPCPFHHTYEKTTCGADHYRVYGGVDHGHNGVDINTVNVYAAAKGTIVRTKGLGDARGRTILIEHKLNSKYSYYSYYQHLKSIEKSKGDVNPGDLIGISGGSGWKENSWGRHLHFGLVIGPKGGITWDQLAAIEQKPWLIESGITPGPIVVNPSVNTKKEPSNTDAKANVLKHAGSVTYVFDKNEVNVGGKIDPPPHSKLWLTDKRIPSGNLPYGRSFGIYGGVQSEYYNIKKVKTSIKNSKNQDVIDPIVENLNGGFYSFRGRVNNELVFKDTNVFKEDHYTFIVEVWDEKDYKDTPKKFTSNFTIGNPGSNSKPQPKPPTYDVKAIPGGYSVSIKADSDAEIRYTTNGSDPTKSSTKYNGGFAVKSTCTVKAIAIKDGVASGAASKTVTVNKVAQPKIKSKLTAKNYTVEISCDTSGAKIYYTLDGATPSPYKNYYSKPFPLTNSAKIRAYAIKDGMTDSKEAEPVTIQVSVPSAPDMSIKTGSDIAVGDPIEVSWKKIDNATSYEVEVYKNRKRISTASVTGTEYVYVPKESGEYTFGVDAVNFVGKSGTYSTQSVTAHDPVTVTFVDYDNTVIKTQKVDYGRTATVPPNPKRKGYVFSGWNSGDYIRVTRDVTVKALYEREKYIVRFVDENGITLAPQQEVEFEGSVTLPPAPSNGLEGYSFMGWRTISADNSSLLDYTNVDADLTLQAVFDWGNKDLPVAVQNASATKSTGNKHMVYTVSAKLNNGASETTYCRIIITLKTSMGKAVQTAIRDFTISAKATNVAFSSGEIICDKSATKAEINIVGLDENGNRTGGAYSNSYLINSIDDQAKAYYTDWSETRSHASNVEETKTMYRYRDKMFTTSTSPDLSGWTQYDSTTSYGAWSSNKTTTSKPTASDTLQIISSSTTYNYYHYCSKYDGKWNVDSCWVNSTSKRHTYSTTNKLPSYTINADKGGKRTQCYGYKGCTNQHPCSYNFYVWWIDSTVTTYTYQTRSKTTTYYFWKWGNWSNWSETPVSSNGNREVQTTTYYRYKITPQSTTEGEDNTGTRITMSGSLVDKTALDLAGRKATIFVYKAQLNDPTANYIEYMGQTTIGAENTYNFSFVPAETPDEAESNFIVALAIEGQTSLFNIDVIEKTIKEQYQVDFFADGELINTQMVSEGSDAIVPEPPEIPGKVFVGWNNDTTNVIASRKIEAYYVDESYSVVFVDFETEFVSMKQYNYGEVIAVPEPGRVEGKTFLGWEGLDEDDPIAKEHAIYIAKYETGTFTVKFEDGYNNVISTQSVEYGEAADLPEAPEKEGLVFMGWSQSVQWWNVKEDMIVTPVWVYENTVASPDINVEDLYIGGEISAETATEGSTLYYAIDDGSGEPPMTIAQRELEEGYIADETDEPEENNNEHDPLSMSLINLFTSRAFANNESFYSDESNEKGYDVFNWNKYEDSLILNSNETVYFYATADDMNDSEIVTLNYEYQPVMDPYEDHTDETYNVTFFDYDGFVFDEQTVNYFESAVAPEVEEREGYIFTGWDNRFDHVTEDMEVTAQYVPEDEYVIFALSNNTVTLTAGDTYTLNYTIENAPEDMGDITWKSSDKAVATVGADGVVTAKQAGEAVITAKAGFNTASCKITVLPNSNETVTLRSNSKLSLENGLLTQIPIVLTGNRGVAATVGEIKEQLATPNVKIIYADGSEPEDSKPIATNTQIRIIVDDIVIDAVIVIVTGDYDGNGNINNRDASRIMRYLVSKESPDEYQLYASDVNKDGDVNNRDAAMVSRYLVGKETI